MAAQILSIELEESNISSHPTIPRTDKAKNHDNELQLVQNFLTDPKQPQDMSIDAFKRLVRYAAGFFTRDGKLWKKDSRNKHKLVVPEDRRYEIIRQAHDGLGHKGIFTVRTRLSE